jgi:hypothetical protein
MDLIFQVLPRSLVKEMEEEQNMPLLLAMVLVKNTEDKERGNGV